MKIIKTHEMDPDQLTEFERDCVYNGLDCCVTRDVFDGLHPQLDNHTGGTYAFSKSLQAPTLEMRCRGVLVDDQRKAEVIDEYFEIMERVERQLNRIVFEGVGLESFNWRSHSDLRKLFYDTLGIPPIRKQGRPTTDRGAREKLAVYPVAQQLVSHINILTTLGDKISVLRTAIDPDGRIRSSYNIAGTSTGRFSSSASEFGTGGNLQNVEESLRSIFISDPGMKFAKCDAKSGESFCVGAIEWNLFNDGRFLDACESGDPHTAVARICWPSLPWTGDLKRDKDIAEQPYYRHYTYRFMCKKLGHGCLTPDHEVLTRTGWVAISDRPDEIMIWNEHSSGFAPVLGWTDFEYTGDLHTFAGNSISAVMTSDHRIPYKKDSRQEEIYEARADRGPQAKMPLGDDYEGGLVTVPARLIAAVMADGNITDYGVDFHFKKPRKIDRLCDLCDLAGYDYNVYNNADGTTKINVKAFGLPKHPGAFMFEWTARCLRDFLDELKYWDGHIGDTSVSISSTKFADLEWYQTFGRILGIGGSISKPYTSGFGSTVYRLQQNNRKWASGSSIEWSSCNVTRQRVLCPTVHSGWFYVRHKGKIFITGNSNYGGRPETLAEQAKLDISVVRDFQPKYFAAFPAHQRWQKYVDETLRRQGYLVSLLGRKRWFFGRRNDPSTLREAIAYDPQSSLAELVNQAMLNIWRQDIAAIMMHDHDALTFMYPEKDEDIIIPQIMANLSIPVELNGGRIMRIPYDCKIGYNKGDYDPVKNPNGLKDYNGTDTRKRQPQVGILDRVVRKGTT